MTGAFESFGYGKIRMVIAWASIVLGVSQFIFCLSL